MARTIPSGTGVTRGFPPDLVSDTQIVQGNSWTQRYIADFVSEATGTDFKTSGGNFTVNGAQWTTGDHGNSDLMKNTNGTGFQIQAKTSAASTWYNAAPLTAPRIYADVQSGSNPLYSGLGLTQTFAIQAIIDPTTDVGSDYEEYGLALFNTTADQPSISVTAVRQHNAAAFAGSDVGPKLTRSVNFTSANSWGGRSLVNGSNTSHPAYTFFEIVYSTGGAVTVNISAETDFVEPLSSTTFSAFVTTNSTITTTSSDVDFVRSAMRVGFYIANNNASSKTAFKPTLKKLRLLTLG